MPMKNKNGFTLLEVLVALAIAGGLLVSVIALVNHNLDVVNRYQTETIAGMLAKQKILELKRSPVEETGKFPDPYSDYEYSSRIEDGPLPGLKSMLVVVTKEGASGDSASFRVFFRG